MLSWLFRRRYRDRWAWQSCASHIRRFARLEAMESGEVRMTAVPDLSNHGHVLFDSLAPSGAG